MNNYLISLIIIMEISIRTDRTIRIYAYLNACHLEDMHFRLQISEQMTFGQVTHTHTSLA